MTKQVSMHTGPTIFHKIYLTLGELTYSWSEKPRQFPSILSLPALPPLFSPLVVCLGGYRVQTSNSSTHVDLSGFPSASTPSLCES